MSDELVLEEEAGRIAVTPAALERIVQHAVEAVDGAKIRRRRRGLDVHLSGRRARVELEVTARYGTILPELAHAVQERVASALAKMCSLEVEAVDVSIDELDES